MTATLIIDYVLWTVRVGLIVGGCWILYRALRLATLPWIAAWYALELVARSASAYFFHQIVPPGWTPGTSQPLPSPLSALVMATDLAAELSTLLVVLLIFAEAAFVLQRLAPDLPSGLFRRLAETHRFVRPLGITTLVLAVVSPCVPMVYYYAHGHL
ncbi:MAG TPA: hypothetical protein VGL24_13280 [Chthoniobacterales bacterium]